MSGAWEGRVEWSEGKCGEEEGLRELRYGWRGGGNWEGGGGDGVDGHWARPRAGIAVESECGWRHGRGRCREGKCGEEWISGLVE